VTWGRTRHQTRLDMKETLRGARASGVSSDVPALWQKLAGFISQFDPADYVSIGDAAADRSLASLFRLAQGCDFDVHEITPATITADQDDYDPGAGLYVRLGMDANRTITGLAGANRGRCRIIHNVSAFVLTLPEESTSSAAGNRWQSSTAGTIQTEIRSGEAAVVWFDKNAGGDGNGRKIVFKVSSVTGDVLQLTRVGIGAAPDATAPLRVFGGEILQETAANGAVCKRGYNTELITIAAAASSDSSANLLPTNSIIEGVVYYVSVQPPGTSTMNIGNALATTRFATGVSTAVGGGVANAHMSGSVATDANGPTQTTNAKIRITPNATPSDASGRVRVTVWYRTYVPPTS
jgi:hypothetical protein